MALGEAYMAALALPPLVAGLTGYFVKPRLGSMISLLASVIVLASSISLMISMVSAPGLRSSTHIVASEFILDPLACVGLTVLSLVYFASSLYSVGFVPKEVEMGRMSERKARVFNALTNIFILTMILTVTSNNIFIMWVAVEATTLASAFLVALYGKAESLEAAWKYVVICSLGLVFGLFGTALLYAEASKYIGASAMLWFELMKCRAPVPMEVLAVSLILLVIGYGTKAGVAPMWTWLPDAHAEAPAPISALLSGVLIKCALICLARYVAVAVRYGVSVVPSIVMWLGILSMWIAALFIVVSRDVKRLLAFHSVENMGISATGIGFASAAAVFGGLYHVITHGLVKSMLFLLSGILVWIYGTRDMRLMGGLARLNKVLGASLVMGALALGCSPPFAMFTSYMAVLYGGVKAGLVIPVALYVAASAVVFGGIVSHALHIAFGELTTKTSTVTSTAIPYPCIASILLILVLVTLLGFYVPEPLSKLLSMAVGEVLSYGGP